MVNKKFPILFLAIFLGFVSLNFVSAVTNVSVCGNITSSGEYELNTSLQAGAGLPCLMINVSDVILDCINYSYFINGTDSANTMGVGVIGSQTLTNVTVKNCNISRFDMGVWFNNTNNSLIFNNTFYNDSTGIDLSFTLDINVSTNNITTFAFNLSAIFLMDDNSSVVENNIVTTNNVSAIGILISNSVDTIANLNTITTSGINSSGVLLEDGSTNISLTTNTITTSNVSSMGIQLFDASSSCLLFNNIITTSENESFGIYFEGASNMNISSNNITTSGVQADGISVHNSNDSIIKYNIIQTTHFNACVIHLDLSPYNNTFYDNIINTSSNHSGACLDETLANNWNTTETATTNIVGRANIGGNFWTNNASTGYSDTCIDSDGDYFCDTAYNLAGLGSEDTNNIDYLPLANHTNMISGCDDPLNEANKTYSLNQTITEINGTCFNITANNITLYLNGEDITGNGTGYGINISGYNDTRIFGRVSGGSDQGVISNFSNGLYINASSSNSFEYFKINNSVQDAILLEGDTSSNNNFTGIIALNTNISHYDINFSTTGINGTWIIDIQFTNYTFTGAGGLVNFKEIDYGEIVFLEAINGSGTSLKTDVDIDDNWVFVNSSKSGLNKSANISLYSITYTDPKPQYSSDNSAWTDCTTGTDPACVEISYNASTDIHIFNVSHFTYFKSAEGYTAPTTNGGTSDDVGGGETTVEKTEKHSWVKIIPGEPITMTGFSEDYGIKEIEIKVTIMAENVKITVEKHSGKPTEVTKEKLGKVYSYLQIMATNLEGKLDKATIKLKIPKSWFEENNLEKDDIALFRFNEAEEKWGELTTTYTESDNDYYYYDVELTSLSYFVIGEKVEEEEEVVGLVETLKKDLTWLWIIIGVIVLAAIIGGGIAVKKREQ